MATNTNGTNSPKKNSRSSNSELAVSRNGTSREDGHGPNDEVNGVAALEQGPQQQQQPAPQAGVFQLIRSLVLNVLIVYFIVNFFRRPQTAPTATTTGADLGPSSAPQPSQNLFPNGLAFDMYVYVSEKEEIAELSRDAVNVWTQTGIVYGDWVGGGEGDGTYKSDVRIPASESVRRNGSLYAHVYLVKSGRSPDPKEETYSKRHTVYKRKMLNKYKKKRYTKTHNLLTGETAASAEAVMKAETMKEEVLSHWHPNLTINVINDQTPWVKGSIPPPLDEYIEFEPMGSKYYPVVFFNDYWNLGRDYTPINSTTEVLNLTLTYQPLSVFRWQLYTAQTVRNKWTSSFLGEGLMEESDEDQDSLKEAFLETSPYLLGLTVIISICHSVFEFMAFKNDIQFWKNRTNLEGLSVRSVFFNVFQSLIVLLYVLDNETNTVVRVSVFIGLIIEIWKIQKVVNIELNREDKFLGILPKIKISDKGSYVESSTKQYDMMAFRYLSWALYPLLLGYAVYSLLYVEQKGWYSWVLSLLYGFLLTFGFIMMTPQLFINYKLKSVAHLPWRMMTYKALNTFIDDIFAFVIKMPTMYRIGCFRDDIVFFIYLYQRWIYRVDPKRVNEFGTSGDAAAPGQEEPRPAILPPPSPAKKNSRRKKTD